MIGIYENTIVIAFSFLNDTSELLVRFVITNLVTEKTKTLTRFQRGIPKCRFSRWKPDIPQPLYDIGLSIGRAIGLTDLSVIPSFIAASSHELQDGAVRRQNDQSTANHLNQTNQPTAIPQYDQMPLMTPPSEENINQLHAMGFDREAVVRALTESDNNLEHAANRLLSGI
jgi:hypothetical protein